MSKHKRPKRFTLKWFLNFFKSIPKEKWTTNYLKTYGGAEYCALGHLQREFGYRDGYFNPAVRALNSLIKEKSKGRTLGITQINDRKRDNNAKQRVVKYLSTLVKREEKRTLVRKK